MYAYIYPRRRGTTAADDAPDVVTARGDAPRARARSYMYDAHERIASIVACTACMALQATLGGLCDRWSRLCSPARTLAGCTTAAGSRLVASPSAADLKGWRWSGRFQHPQQGSRYLPAPEHLVVLAIGTRAALVVVVAQCFQSLEQALAADGLASSVVHLKHDGRVRACCSLDASWLATASGGSVHCWDGAVTSGSSSVSIEQALRSISLEHIIGEVQSLSGTPGPSGGTQVLVLAGGTAPKKQVRRCSPGATSTTAGTVAMLDLRTSGSTVGALVGHADTVWHVQGSAGRPWLACSASADGSAKVWDIRTQRVLHTVHGGHRGGIRRCIFACEGDQQGQLSILTGGFDRTIRVHTLTGEVATSTDAACCATSDRPGIHVSRLLARMDGYCFGLDASERWVVAGAGNPDYRVRLWGPLGAQSLSHQLKDAHTLLGKFVFVVRHYRVCRNKCTRAAQP